MEEKRWRKANVQIKFCNVTGTGSKDRKIWEHLKKFNFIGWVDEDGNKLKHAKRVDVEVPRH